MATKEATAPPNGADPTKSHQPPERPQPVDSFKDAAPLLRRPFTPEAVKFKVQATWDGGALVVPYIDARLAIDRMNMIVPHLWSQTYEATATGLMWCHLTIDEITRSDVGEEVGQGSAGKKGLVSDALKRAAVHFGIGVSLYATPKLTVYEKDGHLAKAGGRDKYRLTPNGTTRCRSIYASWLDAIGRQAFGNPLDHGDALDAAGDAEAEGPPEGVDPETGEIAPTLDAESIERITLGISALKLSYKQINLLFGEAGANGLTEQDQTPDGVKAAVGRLTKDQAVKAEARLEAWAQDADAEAPQDGGQG